jgi:hypothetical protein
MQLDMWSLSLHKHRHTTLMATITQKFELDFYVNCELFVWNGLSLLIDPRIFREKSMQLNMRSLSLHKHPQSTPLTTIVRRTLDPMTAASKHPRSKLSNLPVMASPTARGKSDVKTDYIRPFALGPMVEIDHAFLAARRIKKFSLKSP